MVMVMPSVCVIQIFQNSRLVFFDKCACGMSTGRRNAPGAGRPKAPRPVALFRPAPAPAPVVAAAAPAAAPASLAVSATEAASLLELVQTHGPYHDVWIYF